MKASRLAIVGVGALFLHALQPGILAGLPPGWTHTLKAESCQWERRPWLSALGGDDRPRYVPETIRAEMQCMRGRGLKSAIPVLKVVLGKWPSQAAFAAMSQRQGAHDEDRIPLPAVVANASQLRPGDPG